MYVPKKFKKKRRINIRQFTKRFTDIIELVLGPGTFGLLAYFLSEELESLYIPRYVLDEMPKGEWGVKLNIVELPKYIKCGEWRNTVEQRNILVNYK